MTAAAQPNLTHMAGDFTASECAADIVTRPGPAGMSQGTRTLLQAAFREGDIRCDADIPRRNPLGDPVIGCVGAIADDDNLHPCLLWRADWAGPVMDH